MSRTQALFWAVLYLMLGAVAAAAAVLSFSALRDLAVLCGFQPQLAWLLPITIDAGAAAASAVWLSRWVDVGARDYGRVLALVLLGSSVAGNTVDHYLRAYTIAAPWWVVVIVSAIAPAVLAALVHLAQLVARSRPVTHPGTQATTQVTQGTTPPERPKVSLTKATRPDVALSETNGHAPPPSTPGPNPAPPREPSPDPDAELFTKILTMVRDDPKIGRPRITQALGVTDTPRLRGLVARAKEHAASTNGAPTS
jgi:hypothetical protein